MCPLWLQLVKYTFPFKVKVTEDADGWPWSRYKFISYRLVAAANTHLSPGLLWIKSDYLVPAAIFYLSSGNNEFHVGPKLMCECYQRYGHVREESQSTHTHTHTHVHWRRLKCLVNTAGQTEGGVSSRTEFNHRDGAETNNRPLVLPESLMTNTKCHSWENCARKPPCRWYWERVCVCVCVCYQYMQLIKQQALIFSYQ